MTTTDLLIDAVSHRFPAQPGQSPDHPPTLAGAAGFQMRLASNAADVVAAQQLRRECFADRGAGNGEWAAVDAWASQRVEQYFDDRSDHLIVWHQGAAGVPQVAATARLLPPHANDAAPRGAGLAADQHFGVRPLERLLNSTVEVGRACVHPDHRGGTALALLTGGIARYQYLTGYRYLLGCASLDLADGGQSAAQVWDLALASHLAPADRRCRPRDPIAIGGLARSPHPVVPPLLRNCLRIGAKVCGPPGYNAATGTADFLLLLDVHDRNRATSHR